jgi:hypothetical protein
MLITMMSQKFPADLIYAVRESIREQDFCVFGSKELDRLLAEETRNDKRQTLENFAAFSGVKMETTPNLNSARFISPPTHTDVRPALRSPVCSDSTLTLTELEPELFAYRSVDTAEFVSGVAGRTESRSGSRICRVGRTQE